MRVFLDNFGEKKIQPAKDKNLPHFPIPSDKEMVLDGSKGIQVDVLPPSC